MYFAANSMLTRVYHGRGGGSGVVHFILSVTSGPVVPESGTYGYRSDVGEDALSGSLGVCAWCLHHKRQREALKCFSRSESRWNPKDFEVRLSSRMFLIRTVV